MSFGIIAATAVTGIVGAVGASQSANAQKKAQAANLASKDLAELRNAAIQFSNYGAPIPYIEGVTDDFYGQSSYLYPIYGADFEQQMWRDATGAYNSTAVPMSRLTRANERMGPTIDAATGTVRDIFSGADLNLALNNARPVFDARNKQAETQIGALNLELEEQLNGIRQARVGQGFVGDSLSIARLGSDASMRNAAAGAGLRSGARLANAMDERAIRDADRSSRMANVNAPFQMSQNLMGYETAPQQSYTNLFNQRRGIMDFARRSGSPNINYTPFQYEPIATNGMIAANAVGNMAQGFGNAWANNQYQQQQDRRYAELADAWSNRGSGNVDDLRTFDEGLFGNS